MPPRSDPKLSRRQQQILEAIYRRGQASVRDIQDELPEPPSPGAIRRMLGVLTGKGAIECRAEGPRKVYRPTVGASVARTRALRKVVDTFFGGSTASALASLLREGDLRLGAAEREALSDLIEKAKERGR